MAKVTRLGLGDRVLRLRILRRRGVWTIRRLEARPDTERLAHGIRARVVAIELALQRDADLAVEEVRHLGLGSALLEPGSNDAQARAAWTVRLGELSAERFRLDARLAAEERAFSTTFQLLRIRLSGLVAASTRRRSRTSSAPASRPR